MLGLIFPRDAAIVRSPRRCKLCGTQITLFKARFAVAPATSAAHDAQYTAKLAANPTNQA